MRSQATRTETKIIERAASVAQTRFNSTPAAGNGVSPAIVGTRSMTDGDGNVQTQSILMWNEDAWNDPSKVWLNGAAEID
jgi:hypothetical protein